MTKNAKQTYKQGDDGRLYFTYNLDSEYKLRPPYGEVFNYRIVECEFDEETETEYYRIESAGEELSARYSVSQMEILLNQFPYEEISAGEPVELPLLLSEVKAFFAAKRLELKKANVKENEKLKGTSYNENLKTIKALSERARFFRSNGDEDKAQELEENLNKIEAEQAKLLEEKKVDIRILHKTPDCPVCYDTGEVNGKICDCARDMTDKIKAYNAELRLAR